MSEASPKLASVAATAGRLACFVFLVLGIPIIIFLPSTGFDLPSVPPLLNRIAASIFYGLLAGFGGFCGFPITCVLINIAYRRITGAHPGDNHTYVSPITLLWWCWGAILSWAMFIGFGKALVSVWMSAE